MVQWCQTRIQCLKKFPLLVLRRRLPQSMWDLVSIVEFFFLNEKLACQLKCSIYVHNDSQRVLLMTILYKESAKTKFTQKWLESEVWNERSGLTAPFSGSQDHSEKTDWNYMDWSTLNKKFLHNFELYNSLAKLSISECPKKICNH